MSTKRRYIQEANLISEQRYINNKFLMEAEDPTTPPATQTTDQPSLFSFAMEPAKMIVMTFKGGNARF